MQDSVRLRCIQCVLRMNRTLNMNRIRSLREAAGQSQAQVAAAMGVDQTTVFRWETGRTKIDDERKTQLAELFKCTRSHLMGWDEEAAA